MRYFSALFAAALLPFAATGASAESLGKLKSYTKDKSYDDLTAAEHTAARTEARNRKLDLLRVCADPGNMPQSNNKAEGYQNKIAKILADDLGAQLHFFWRPYHERGLTRETFQNDECDILMDMPVALQSLLTTDPIYASTYVFAHREDAKLDIQSLDDPALKSLRIGVFQHSGIREALVRRGFGNLDLHIISYDTDLRPEHQPWQQVQRVIDKQLDIAAVWGPFAGWLKTMKGAPLVIQPINQMDDKVPLEFELSIGMLRNQVLLKYMLDWAIMRQKDAIAAVLNEYGVPLVECARCAVSGTIPSHGSYYERLRAVKQDRFLKQDAPMKLSADATPDQVVTQERVEHWLEDGADLNMELQNAIVGNDAGRVKFLISKGADVNLRDSQGLAPVHTAARTRNGPLVELLVQSGADINARDSDGFTALLHAINRNHVPTIEMLKKLGADLELGTTGDIKPLTWAIGDGKYYAAKALIDVGANVNSGSGPEAVTPLMTAATQLVAQTRTTHVAQGPSPIDIARLLIEKGAKVDAVSKDSVTALMIAAGHNNVPMISLLAEKKAKLDLKSSAGKTALEIAEIANHEHAIKALRFVARPTRASSAPGEPAAQN